MKCICPITLNILQAKFLIVVICIKIIANSENLSKTHSEAEEKFNKFPCEFSCNSCQNSLYYLKNNRKIDCRFSQCPDLCLMISSRFYSGLNPHINFFIKNHIGSCDTCFRLDLCHYNQCQYQQNLLHSTIKNVIEKTKDFHILHENNILFNQINKRSADYIFNMNLILANMKNMENILEKYILLWNNSKQIKNIYLKIFFIIKKRKFIINNALPGTVAISRIDPSNEFQNIIIQLNNKFKGLIDKYSRKIEENKIFFLPSIIYDSQIIFKNQKTISDYINSNQDLYTISSEVLLITERIKDEIFKNSKLVHLIKLDLSKNSKYKEIITEIGLIDPDINIGLQINPSDKFNNNIFNHSLSSSAKNSFSNTKKNILKHFNKASNVNSAEEENEMVSNIELDNTNPNEAKKTIKNSNIERRQKIKYFGDKSKLKTLINRVGNKNDMIKDFISNNEPFAADEASNPTVDVSVDKLSSNLLDYENEDENNREKGKEKKAVNSNKAKSIASDSKQEPETENKRNQEDNVTNIDNSSNEEDGKNKRYNNNLHTEEGDIISSEENKSLDEQSLQELKNNINHQIQKTKNYNKQAIRNASFTKNLPLSEITISKETLSLTPKSLKDSIIKINNKLQKMNRNTNSTQRNNKNDELSEIDLSSKLDLVDNKEKQDNNEANKSASNKDIEERLQMLFNKLEELDDKYKALEQKNFISQDKNIRNVTDKFFGNEKITIRKKDEHFHEKKFNKTDLILNMPLFPMPKQKNLEDKEIKEVKENDLDLLNQKRENLMKSRYIENSKLKDSQKDAIEEKNKETNNQYEDQFKDQDLPEYSQTSKEIKDKDKSGFIEKNKKKEKIKQSNSTATKYLQTPNISVESSNTDKKEQEESHKNINITSNNVFNKTQVAISSKSNEKYYDHHIYLINGDKKHAKNKNLEKLLMKKLDDLKTIEQKLMNIIPKCENADIVNKNIDKYKNSMNPDIRINGEDKVIGHEDANDFEEANLKLNNLYLAENNNPMRNLLHQKLLSGKLRKKKEEKLNSYDNEIKSILNSILNDEVINKGYNGINADFANKNTGDREERNLNINNNNQNSDDEKSVFPLLFLETSVKKLDQDLFNLKEQIFPDLFINAE